MSSGVRDNTAGDTPCPFDGTGRLRIDSLRFTAFENRSPSIYGEQVFFFLDLINLKNTMLAHWRWGLPVYVCVLLRRSTTRFIFL